MSLNIQEIQEDENGNIYSDAMTTKQYTVTNVLKSRTSSAVIDMEDEQFVDYAYVTMDTFQSIQKIVSIDETENVYDLLQAIYVDVESIYDVDQCAKLLEENGYLIDYHHKNNYQTCYCNNHYIFFPVSLFQNGIKNRNYYSDTSYFKNQIQFHKC